MTSMRPRSNPLSHSARVPSSAREIASQAKIVFTCLPSLEALRAVTLGKDGLYAGDAIETYVDLSTTGSEFAQELAASLREHGIMMLDSPITQCGHCG